QSDLALGNPTKLFAGLFAISLQQFGNITLTGKRWAVFVGAHVMDPDADDLIGMFLLDLRVNFRVALAVVAEEIKSHLGIRSEDRFDVTQLVCFGVAG